MAFIPCFCSRCARRRQAGKSPTSRGLASIPGRTGAAFPTRNAGNLSISLKHRYDRVRPSVLDPELGHLFPVPAHPAYPSGHSTQAFTIAYLLQELDPEHAETYRADAMRIARNREIAGFHYPSDTAGGRLAARQLVDLLLANPEFRSLLEAAKQEW